MTIKISKSGVLPIVFALAAFGWFFAMPLMAASFLPVSAKAASVKETAGPPFKKARKMDDGESAGIALSVESAASDVHQTDKAVAAPSGSDSQAVSAKASRRFAAHRRKPSHPHARRLKAKKTVSIPVRKEAALLSSAKADSAEDQGKADAPLEQALAAYNARLKKKRNDREALEGKVGVLDRMGTDEALDQLDALVEAHPGLASAHAAQAHILMRQKDTLVALDAWRQAVALDPGNKDYRLGLAGLTDQLGRGEEAYKLYKAIPGPLPPEAQARFEALSDKYAD